MSNLKTSKEKDQKRRSRYHSRFERPAQPERMRLTERDTKVVLAVYDYRALTTDQIAALLFRPKNPGASKLSICRRRLQLLWQNEFLERQFLQVGPLAGGSPAVYLLGRRGAELVTRELGLEPSQVKWYPSYTKVTDLFLEHTLKISDFRVAITLAAESRGHSITKWISEAELKAYKERVVDPKTTGKEKKRTLPLAPDGYFVYAGDDWTAHFFLEMDMGTMESRRFGNKIRAYTAYWDTGAYKKRYQTDSLRILTVTTGERRMKNLKRVTERQGGQRMFWFTTFDSLDPDKILGPVWCRASGDDGERLGLIG